MFYRNRKLNNSAGVRLLNTQDACFLRGCYQSLCIMTGRSFGQLVNKGLEDLQPPFCSLLQDFPLSCQTLTEADAHIFMTFMKSHTPHHTCYYDQSKCRSSFTAPDKYLRSFVRKRSFLLLSLLLFFTIYFTH